MHNLHQWGTAYRISRCDWWTQYPSNSTWKSKVNISICRRKSYQRTYIENICSIFDQARPVVSHLEVHLLKKPPTPKNISEGLKGPQRQFWKESLFVKYDKNKNVSLLSDPIPIKSFPEGKKSSIHSLLLVLRKVTALMHGNFLHDTVQMGFLRLKVLVLINHTVQCHILNHS